MSDKRSEASKLICVSFLILLKDCLVEKSGTTNTVIILFAKPRPRMVHVGSGMLAALPRLGDRYQPNYCHHHRLRTPFTIIDAPECGG